MPVSTISAAGALASLDEFTDRWDTRNGRERNLAGELSLTTSQANLVLDAADALGLCQVQLPRRTSYDYVLLLGGLVRACIARPAYAAHLIGNGHLRAGAVVALGGHRPFGGDEFDYARALGIADVAEEYEAMDAGTRRAFGLGEPDAVEGETSDQVGGTWGSVATGPRMAYRSWSRPRPPASRGGGERTPQTRTPGSPSTSSPLNRGNIC